MRLLLTAVALFLASTASAASPPLERARSEDALLRKSEEKLRKRHNIMRVIDLWRDAEESASSDEERRDAARGLVEAWALLARWSGLANDADQAKAVAAKLEVHRLRGVEVSGAALEIDATGKYQIAKGTYGEHRLYFDLSPLVAVKEALGALQMEAEEVLRARVTQLDADTVRIIFDFVGPVPSYLVSERTIRLKLATDEGSSHSELSKIVAEVKEAFPDVVEESQKETRLKKSTREAARPRARSLLAIHKVVIDAGHGGKDAGAIGLDRIREKDVNLAIAMKLGEELQKLGVKVVYTRTNDRFLSLEKRTSIANRSGADLFISIHANSNRSRHIHGVETYYLNTSSSRYASRLARRENGQAEEPELDPEERGQESVELPDGALGADLRLILADLAMRSATTESKRLAGYVQSSMVGVLRRDFHDVKDLGVKHALFAVLIGVRMPSVLIETGFVTHPTESQRLRSSAYQANVAKAIARGVGRLMEERQELAVVR